MDFFTFGPDVLGFVSLFNAVFIFGIPLLIVVLSITKYIFKFTKDFQSEVTVESKFVGDLPSSDTIHLHFPRSHGHSHSYTIELGDDARIKDDQLLIRSVDVNLKKATDNLLSLRLEKSGRGSNSVVANDYLDYMDSNISVEGNHIYIPQSYSISKGGKFRAQNLEVTINIPEGKHIVFDKNIRSYHLNRVDMAEGYKRRFRNQNATWKMTKDGLANNLTAEESNNSTSASQVSISLSATKGIDINVSSEED